MGSGESVVGCWRGGGGDQRGGFGCCAIFVISVWCLRFFFRAGVVVRGRVDLGIVFPCDFLLDHEDSHEEVDEQQGRTHAKHACDARLLVEDSPKERSGKGAY